MPQHADRASLAAWACHPEPFLAQPARVCYVRSIPKSSSRRHDLGLSRPGGRTPGGRGARPRLCRRRRPTIASLMSTRWLQTGSCRRLPRALARGPAGVRHAREHKQAGRLRRRFVAEGDLNSRATAHHDTISRSRMVVANRARPGRELVLQSIHARERRADRGSPTGSGVSRSR